MSFSLWKARRHFSKIIEGLGEAYADISWWLDPRQRRVSGAVVIVHRVMHGSNLSNVVHHLRGLGQMLANVHTWHRC